MTDLGAKAEMREVVCLTCGSVSKKYVALDGDRWAHSLSRCPKCSKTAYTIGIQSLGPFMAAVAKDLVRIKGDIMDLQGAAEGEGER